MVTRGRGRAGRSLVVAALLAACSGGGPEPAGVRGTAVAVSDVVGEPEAAITEGWVLAVPEAQLPELWATAGGDAPAAADLPYWNPNLPSSTVEELGATLVAVDGDGSFLLDVPAGGYLVCLLERDDPLVPFGCDQAALDPDVPTRLAAGEGGIRVG
jgi:hypothetical protein